MKKNAKKKLYALLLAAILAVGASAAAIAGSVTGNETPPPSATGNDLSGNTAVPPIAQLPPTSEVEELAKGATVSGSNLVVTTVSQDMANHMKELHALNSNDFNVTYSIPYSAKLVAAFNLTLSAGQSIPAGGLIVPIRVNTAKSGDYVIVLHRRADYIWEVVARGFLGPDLMINATFNSLSPVMVLQITAEDAAAGGILSPGTED